MGEIRCLAEAHGDNFALYNGDCIDIAKQLPDKSVHMALYSPPFSNLYTYSDSLLDLGNCENDAQFLEHYGFLVAELYRTLIPGRLVVVHCKDLVNYKGRDGAAGLRDFPGDLIRVHQAAGFALASRVTIWKCPVTEMQRTKAHGLLYKTLRNDSTFSRQGLAEYLLVFRRWAGEGEENFVEPVTKTKEQFPLDVWQKWASPVWDDIDQTNVLNVEMAREDRDEKHMCPLQLDVIERAVVLWTNPGDVIFSPFAGIGSEGVGALKKKRRFIGTELKESYFRQGAKNLAEATIERQPSLF